MVETDAMVLARMRTAVRVLGEAGLDGLDLDAAPDRDSQLRRAVRWQRYSLGPVPAGHRACAMDVARGSLRLWSAAGGVPDRLAGRVPRSVARMRLSTLVRTRCAALRADLAAEAAGLTRRGVAGYGDRVRREVLRVWAEVESAAADYGPPCDAPARPRLEDLLPPRRRPRLENRLTTLLGAGFGTGLSLTVGRLVAGMVPDWMPAAGVGCGLMGLALTSWTVLARRLLAERNAAERWMLEVVANLRPALEERVLTGILLADGVQPSR